MEIMWKCKVSAEFRCKSLGTLRKLCVFTKFPHQEINLNFIVSRNDAKSLYLLKENVYRNKQQNLKSKSFPYRQHLIYQTVQRAIFKFKFSIIGFFIIGENALHIACKLKNRSHQVKELLENGFDPNLLDNYGWTALHEASNFGHVASVRELLKSTGTKILSLKFDNVSQQSTQKRMLS